MGQAAAPGDPAGCTPILAGTGYIVDVSRLGGVLRGHDHKL